MPAAFLDRLPLPSLQAYTIGSVILLACSVHYAVQVTSELGLQAAFGRDGSDYSYNTKYTNSTVEIYAFSADRDMFYVETFMKRGVEVVCFMLQEPLCIWTLINMAYCCFILVGKMIQRLVFGELRVAEQQHIKDKFWNFVFYKFIFIFGVMNVQFLDEVVLWCGWFSVLGFLHLLAQLCKDRCEYLSFSPTTPKWTHYRVIALLFGILTMSFTLFGVCVFVGFHAGINTFAFMFAECSLVSVRTLYVIIRYAIYLREVNHNGVWERRASYVYYTELLFEITALTIDFLHHLHMLIWGNIFLSMASLVIAMQLRCLFYEIRHRIKKYKNYLRIVKHMEFNYPMATLEELEKNNDSCAICWDHLDAARKLPCGHLFHNSCLRSWLEQDTSCPTCRQALSDSIEKEKSSSMNDMNHPNILSSLGAVDDTAVHAVNQTTNHFFHFDGKLYQHCPL